MVAEEAVTLQNKIRKICVVTLHFGLILLGSATEKQSGSDLFAQGGITFALGLNRLNANMIDVIFNLVIWGILNFRESSDAQPMRPN